MMHNIILGLVLIARVSLADSSANLSLTEAEQTFINNQDIITEKQTKKSKLIGNMRQIDRDIKLKTNELNRLKTTLSSYNYELTDIQSEINLATEELGAVQTAFENRIQAIYKYQNFGLLEVLFSSNSILSFFETAIWFEKLLTADIDLLNDVKKKHAAWTAYNQKVEARRNRIAVIKEKIQTTLASTASKKATQAAYIKALSDEIKQFETENQTLLANSAELEALIRSRYGDSILGSLSFIKPVIGWISSTFGYRMHPIFKRRIFHSGVDFAAPHGHKIMAVDRGTVLFTGWWGGYGKATIIDHGNDITTVYAHQSRIIIKKGDVIEKGQLIGYIGSTGYSTGPHLHFETRKDGKPTDPMRYFTD